MRAIVQRLLSASLVVDGVTQSSMQKGLLVYVCFAPDDTLKEGQWLAQKLTKLRIFDDEQGAFSRSLMDVHGSILLIPNFTLYAEVKNGTRPSFSSGISFDDAKVLFLGFVDQCKRLVQCHAGEFGSFMQIDSLADGPVNIIIDVPKQK